MRTIAVSRRADNAITRATLGTVMAAPIRSSMAGSGGISAIALADLLGRWPAADGPLYRLLATRIARLTDTGLGGRGQGRR